MLSIDDKIKYNTNFHFFELNDNKTHETFRQTNRFLYK